MAKCDLCGRSGVPLLYKVDTKRLDVINEVRFKHLCSSCLEGCGEAIQKVVRSDKVNSNGEGER